ncbi:MAG: tetratricopeptide repeat protein [Thermosynechococcaceae cyanobacterium]
MEKKPRRWLTIAVLGASSLMFIGLSMVPLIGGILNPPSNPSAKSTASPTATASDSPETIKKEEEGYQLVLKRDPNNQTALQGLVESRLKLLQAGQRKPKDLIEPLTQLAKLNPEQPMYATLLAQAQQQSGDMVAAAQTYLNILTQKPTQMEPLQGYVSLLIQQQRSAEAFDLLQSTIATAKQMNLQQAGSADLPAIELLLGDVYLSQKRDSEAIALYERLQKESPNDFRPVVAKGIVLRNQGKNQDALTLFKSAESLAPVDVKSKIQQLIASISPKTPTPSATSSGSPVPKSSPSP